MDEDTMTPDDWKGYLGIVEEQGEAVPEDDMEGEWEDARKL